jgi:spore coat protein U-like protein
MNKFIRGTVAAVLATAPVAAFAATQTGNLNVTTTIQVACEAPSPSGTLNLPFDSEDALDGQALANTPVTVTVTCYGNPTVNHVEFNNGTHRSDTDVGTPEAGVRYMLKSGAAGSAAAHFLGYKLWAKVGTGATSATIEDSGTNILTGEATNDDRLTIGAASGSFQVTGQVFEDARGAHANAGAVPGGTYNDTVVMTVDYN